MKLVRRIQGTGRAVYPAEAERLLNRIVVGHSLLAGILGRENEPDFRLRLKMPCEPVPPLPAALAADDYSMC